MSRTDTNGEVSPLAVVHGNTSTMIAMEPR